MEVHEMGKHGGAGRSPRRKEKPLFKNLQAPLVPTLNIHGDQEKGRMSEKAQDSAGQERGRQWPQ